MRNAERVFLMFVRSLLMSASIAMSSTLFAFQAFAGNWGENWGEMTWGEIIAAVPVSGHFGLLFLIIALSSLGFWFLRGRVKASLMVVGLTLAASQLAEAQVSVPNTFTDGTPALASEVNANFAALAAAVNSSECATADDVVCNPTLSCPACDTLGSYNQGYTDGGNAVDITTDNQASYDAGVASVDITTDNQASYDAGIASVDITTDNSSLCTDAGGVYDAESDSCTVDLTASTWSQQVCEASGGSWYEATGSCGAPRMWSCEAHSGGSLLKACDGHVCGLDGLTLPPNGSFHLRHAWSKGYLSSQGTCTQGEASPTWGMSAALSAAIPDGQFVCNCPGNNCRFIAVSNCSDIIDDFNANYGTVVPAGSLAEALGF